MGGPPDRGQNNGEGDRSLTYAEAVQRGGSPPSPTEFERSGRGNGPGPGKGKGKQKGGKGQGGDELPDGGGELKQAEAHLALLKQMVANGTLVGIEAEVLESAAVRQEVLDKDTQSAQAIKRFNIAWSKHTRTKVGLAKAQTRLAHIQQELSTVSDQVAEAQAKADAAHVEVEAARASLLDAAATDKGEESSAMEPSKPNRLAAENSEVKQVWSSFQHEVLQLVAKASQCSAGPGDASGSVQLGDIAPLCSGLANNLWDLLQRDSSTSQVAGTATPHPGDDQDMDGEDLDSDELYNNWETWDGQPVEPVLAAGPVKNGSQRNRPGPYSDDSQRS